MRRQIREHNILFLCEDNACLSQMAEAAANHLGPPNTRIFSAGINPSKIPPQVYKVMEELGINMSRQRSKGLSDVPIADIDLVVTFENAERRCPALPSRVRVKHWPVVNPARASGGNAAVLSVFRAGRDEIDKRVFALFLDHWRNVA